MDVNAHVRRLWRHRGTTPPTPRRGPRQQLDLDEIVRTAITIADAEGLAAVSTRAVATRLGVSAMALYAYVGSKEDLLSLMQDQASELPPWTDPGPDLAGDLLAWAEALYGVHLAHPWLAERLWSQATQGPHEQDWLERLLVVLDRRAVPPASRPPVVTMLYATVRATAETTAAYRRMDQRGLTGWMEQAVATRQHIPDLGERYPLSTTLPPLTPDWSENPHAALVAGVRLLAGALESRQGG